MMAMGGGSSASPLDVDEIHIKQGRMEIHVSTQDANMETSILASTGLMNAVLSNLATTVNANEALFDTAGHQAAAVANLLAVMNQTAAIIDDPTEQLESSDCDLLIHAINQLSPFNQYLFFGFIEDDADSVAPGQMAAFNDELFGR
jgi:hypothetical protein